MGAYISYFGIALPFNIFMVFFDVPLGGSPSPLNWEITKMGNGEMGNGKYISLRLVRAAF